MQLARPTLSDGACGAAGPAATRRPGREPDRKKPSSPVVPHLSEAEGLTNVCLGGFRCAALVVMLRVMVSSHT